MGVTGRNSLSEAEGDRDSNVQFNFAKVFCLFHSGVLGSYRGDARDCPENTEESCTRP